MSKDGFWLLPMIIALFAIALLLSWQVDRLTEHVNTLEVKCGATVK